MLLTSVWHLVHLHALGFFFLFFFNVQSTEELPQSAWLKKLGFRKSGILFIPDTEGGNTPVSTLDHQNRKNSLKLKVQIREQRPVWSYEGVNDVIWSKMYIINVTTICTFFI